LTAEAAFPTPADMPRAVVVLAILLLLAALFPAGKWGAASAAHGFAMWHFDDWQKSGDKPDVRTWKWAHEAMRWALKLDPDQGDYSNDMGRLYEYTALNMTEHDSQIQPLLAISLSFFEQTTRLRPAWAVGWVNLAMLKHRTGSIDVEFEQAIGRAMQLGGAETAVQRMIAAVGVAHWRQLTVGMRRKVLHNIHIGLAGPARGSIVSTIAYYRQSAYFCKILPVSDRHYLCGKARL